MIVKNRLIPRPTLSEAHIVAHCYHQAARPCAQGRLHGVSHHLASPMPASAIVSVSTWLSSEPVSFHFPQKIICANLWLKKNAQKNPCEKAIGW